MTQKDVKNEITVKYDHAKKEVDRLTTKRSEELGNSINYIENELQIQELLGKIAAYEEVLDLI